MKILETDRLFLREVIAADADFILELLNTPKFIEFIGDRGVRTGEQAEKYIGNRFTKSYRENGFGLWAIELKTGSVPVGICGFVKRQELPAPDIGFALLPEYERRGFAFEAAEAAIRFGRETGKVSRVLAITTLDNDSSGRLLEKIGLSFEREIVIGEETLKLFSS